MTRQDPHDRNSSTRVSPDAPASGTASGADVTSRMAGTDRHDHEHHDHDHDRDHDHEHGRHATTDSQRSYVVQDAKTSAGATFALVFGLAALFCALTAILAPAAVLFGLIGIILGIAGMKMAKKPGVTGRGVAIGGLVTAILGFLIGAAVLAGLAVLVNDEGALNQLEDRIEDARNNLPSANEITEPLPGNN
jgi:hypothetical protein